MSVTWPVNEDARVLWALVLLAWVLCEYLVFGNEPIVAEFGASANTALRTRTRRSVYVRGLALALAILAISTWAGWRTGFLVVVLAGLAIVLPLLRTVFAARSIRLGAELEVGVNALVLMVTGLAIGNPMPAPLRRIVTVPATSNHLTLIILIIAILVFLSTAGTHIVRGLLAKVGAVPTTVRGSRAPEGGEIDIAEYNRGRLIGVIERLIMTALVAVSAYSALMFLMGAKGLIRSKEFEDHAFAEYFLIGTLASAAVAIVGGLVLQGLTRLLW